MSQKTLYRGAEAIISLKNNQITKDRIKKSYRLSCLDEKLRKQRTKSEAKLLEKTSFLINVPKVIETDNKEKIKMQFIEGKKLSEWLDKLKENKEICEEIGRQVALLHDSDIIHGDLTTSNMILVENLENNASTKKNNQHYKNKINLLINNKNNILSVSEHSSSKEKPSERDFKVYFIDFGLGFHSKRIEDKAVDLHLLRQALEAKHFLHWKELFQAIIKGYKSKDKEKILKQLEKVESRGRYKKKY